MMMRSKISTKQQDGFEITKFDDGSLNFKNLNPPVLIEGEKRIERMRSGKFETFFKWVTNVHIVVNGRWCFSHQIS